MLRPDAVPVPAWDAWLRNHRGRAYLGRAGQAVELSDSARLIWREIDGRRTLRQLAELLAGAYGIDVATAAADTETLLLDLAERDLLSFSTHDPH